LDTDILAKIGKQTIHYQEGSIYSFTRVRAFLKVIETELINSMPDAFVIHSPALFDF